MYEFENTTTQLVKLRKDLETMIKNIRFEFPSKFKSIDYPY